MAEAIESGIEDTMREAIQESIEESTERVFEAFKDNIRGQFGSIFDESNVNYNEDTKELEINDKEIDFKKVNEEHEEANNTGEYTDLYENLGLDPEEPATQTNIERDNNEWKNKNPQINELNERQNAIQDHLGIEQSVEDSNKAQSRKEEMERNPKAKEYYDTTGKMITDVIKAGGKILGSFIKISTVGMAVGEIDKLIHEHQNRMNGCWLIMNADDGSATQRKVKIPPLTCNCDLINSGDSGDTLDSFPEYGDSGKQGDCFLATYGPSTCPKALPVREPCINSNIYVNAILEEIMILYLS